MQGVGGGSSSNKMPTLEEYGTNLTKLAEEVSFLAWLLAVPVEFGLVAKLWLLRACLRLCTESTVDSAVALPLTRVDEKQVFG